MEKTFFYARVSSRDQNLSRQIASFKERGADEENIYADKASGKNLDRQQYQFMKKAMRPGDTLVIASLDRLGRNKSDILNELRDFKEKKIRVMILDIPTSMIEAPEGSEAIFDMVSNILIEVLATFAEKERADIRQRQREGIDAMRRDENGRRISSRSGRSYGRQTLVLPKNWNEVISAWQNGEITAVQAMEKMHMKKASFYKQVKIRNIVKNEQKEA